MEQRKLRIVTDFRVLMRLAKEMGQAEKSGDHEVFAKAKVAHDAYKDLCLKADRMILGIK